MLNKKNRLVKRKEFNYIFKNGKSFVNKTMVLNFLPTKLSDVKVGFSVSKKIGNAVTRNKVKRRMREAFKQLMPLVNQKQNYVFVARKGIENLEFEEIVDSMKYCLKKTNLMVKQNEQNN